MEEPKKALPNPFDTAAILAENENGLLLEGLDREVEQSNNDHTPNFPFFYPVIYHSINLEISQKRSFIVRTAYLTANSIMYSLAFSILISLLYISPRGAKLFQNTILASFNCIFGSIILFYCQYFPFYYAFKDEQPNKTSIPTQIGLLTILFISLLGFPNTGSYGMFTTYDAFKSDKSFAKFFGVIITIWKLMNFVLEFIIFILMRPLFNTNEGLLSQTESLDI